MNQELPDGRSNIVVLGGDALRGRPGCWMSRCPTTSAPSSLRRRPRHALRRRAAPRRLRDAFAALRRARSAAQRRRAGGARAAGRRPRHSPFTSPPASTCDRSAKQRLLAERSTVPPGGRAAPRCCPTLVPLRSNVRSRSTAGPTPTGGDTRGRACPSAHDGSRAGRGARTDRGAPLGPPPPGRAQDLHHGRAADPRVVPRPGRHARRLPPRCGKIVRLLHLAGVPFVARGAGTGLSGGAVADGEAVLVALTRMNRILEVDPARRRAVVQPGRGQRAAVGGGGAARTALRPRSIEPGGLHRRRQRRRERGGPALPQVRRDHQPHRRARGRAG